MHEMKTVEALCRKALEAAATAGATKVTSLTVRIGALSHKSEPHLRCHFEASSGGSILIGADLKISVSDDPTSRQAQEVELVSVEVE